MGIMTDSSINADYSIRAKMADPGSSFGGKSPAAMSHMYTHARMHADLHIHTHELTYIHTPARTHTHT